MGIERPIDRNLVYGNCGDDRFAFLEEDDALDRGILLTLLNSEGVTWGEIRNKASRAYARYVLPRLESDWTQFCEELDELKGLKSHELSALIAADFERSWLGVEPPDSLPVDDAWKDPYLGTIQLFQIPFTEMLCWMPTEVKSLGEYACSMIYEGLEFDESSAPKAARLLRKRGYTCKRSDRLVQEAFLGKPRPNTSTR